MRFAFPHTGNIFPTYLTPSLPFRRRKSSTDSNASSSSTQSTSSNASPNDHDPQTFLSGHSSSIRCSRCFCDLAFSNQIISKGFTGRHGRAYLVAPPHSLETPSTPLSGNSTSRHAGNLPNLPNTHTHKPVSRNLVTGAHTVSDISCSQCGSVLGWKYVAAEEEAQRYKVGKFILETKRVCRTNCWEADYDNAAVDEAGGVRSKNSNDGNDVVVVGDEDVEFDSQDEDECEDLFLGVWTPQAAAKRKKAKAFKRKDD